MDINSLLSPSDGPPSQEPSAAAATAGRASTETSRKSGRRRAPTSAASTASSQSQYSQATTISQQSGQVSNTTAGSLQRPLPAHINVPPLPASPSRHAALQQQSQSQSQLQQQQQQQQQQSNWANVPSPAGSNFSSAGGTYSPRSYTNPHSAVATPPPMDRTSSQQQQQQQQQQQHQQQQQQQRPPLHRAPTSGMDTLADLASMQQQHQQALPRPNIPQRQNSGISVASSRPSLEHFRRMHSGSRGSIDLSMLDSIPKPPVHKARRLVSASLSPEELQEASKLFEHLFDNQHAYRSHLQLVKILRRGFRKHTFGGEGVLGGEMKKDPRSYELVKELQEANEAMGNLFAIGEELWMEQLHDQQLLAYSAEECVAVMEVCQKAVSQEPGSSALWQLFGMWVTTIHRASTGLEPQADSMFYARFSNWSADEKSVARELFGRQQVLDVWRRASQETMYNLYDSHLIWDAYIALLIEDLDRAPSDLVMTSVKDGFERRLQTPHRGWDSTFQQFSQFVSKHMQQSAYEQTMVRVQQMSQMAKLQYNDREPFELRWQQARQSGDQTAEGQTLYEYLEWELSRSRKKKKGHFSLELSRTLHQRALLRFPLYVELWEDFVMFLADELPVEVLSQQMLPVIERATSHCPWSGKLWAHHIRAGELVNLSFEEMSQIKHKATSDGLLDDSPLDEHLAIKTTWCSYLRRRAFSRAHPEEEELDVTEVGIRSALEDLEMLGRQRHGSEYQGDPHYRLERIYIRFCTQVGDGVYIQTARDMWKRLVARCGHSYEFWQWYFVWERYIWIKDVNNRETNPTPRMATGVLIQGLTAPNLDWPEKLIDYLLQHAEDYEDPAGQLAATVAARKTRKVVEKRRAEERAQAERSAVQQQEQQEQQQQQQGQQADSHLEVSPRGDAESSGQAGKRKRDVVEGQGDTATKKSRSTDPDDDVIMTTTSPSNEASQLKRDRENATVTVKNLPAGATEGKIRHFFRDCGNILSVRIVREGQSAGSSGPGASSSSSNNSRSSGPTCTAHIEFDSSDDVLVAQTRDMKSFEGNPITVQVGSGTTLYCANYPAVADEAYIRSLFAPFGEIIDVRFPSLKYNTHRRFCYVQYGKPAQASAASKALDGKELQGKDGEAKLNLVAKLSDPSNKKTRSGALEEGRELHVRNLDWSVGEEELLKPFQKYGTVERVRIPRNVAGKSKGIAFVVFTRAEDATAALGLDDTKMRTRLMKVSMASKVEAKRTATTVVERARSSASPSPSVSLQAGDVGGASASDAATTNGTNSREDITSRTIALLGVPDTVNDARIRAITEQHGRLVKTILRPDHAGAIVEFAETTGAGKASMALEGFEISPGRHIRVGTIQELMASKPERNTGDRLSGPKKEKVAAGGKAQTGPLGSGFIKRPGNGAGRRGGLGVKRGGLASRSTGADAQNGEAKGGGDADNGSKSNADFRALVSQGKAK